MPASSLMSLFGGLCLLLYGLRLAGEGLQGVAGGKLRGLLQSVTHHRVLGLLSGAFMAAMLQSSGATLVMLVSFTSSGFLTLHQALALMLGADIGTTLTAQLLAFQFYDYALVVVGLGALFWLLGKRRVVISMGSSLLGFGFILLALKLLVVGLLPIRENDAAQAWLLEISHYPVLSLVTAALVTAALQSSLATIGILIAFATHGLLSMESALPMILGANIGTCSLALLSSIGEPTEAKRVAIAHAVVKVAGVLAVFPFMGPFQQLVATTADTLPREIANAHLLFNTALALLCLPLTGPLAAVLTKLVAEPARLGQPGQPKHLDPLVLNTPALALGQATRELLRMADITQEMYKATLVAFTRDDEDVVDHIEEQENYLDGLNQAIKLYLTRMAETAMTPAQHREELGLLTIINEMENIGDIIDKNLMELAKKKIYKGLRFSDDGQKEIIALHQMISRHLELVITALTTRNAELAQQVIEAKSRVAHEERQLKQAHIKRLHEGLVESIETSAIHLDVLTNLKRINSHITNVAYAVVEPNFS
ncbi:MAG TPA: Na/Pi cotransporter family protein [Nitrospiria bacterium]|nr:Na/Pi cotransporter family protein [Nitrospiria bacterium]